MQGVGVVLKSTNSPNGNNTVTKVPEKGTRFTELVFFKQSLQWGIFSHVIQGLQEHYVFKPWFFFRKYCPPAGISGHSKVLHFACFPLSNQHVTSYKISMNNLTQRENVSFVKHPLKKRETWGWLSWHGMTSYAVSPRFNGKQSIMNDKWGLVLWGRHSKNNFITHWYRWQIRHSISDLPSKLNQLLWGQICLWFDIRIVVVSII